MNGKPKTAAIALLYLVGGIYTAVFAVSVYVDFMSVILFIAGGAACYMLGAAVHEAGHISAAKIFGFKVVGYSIAFITVDKIFGKTSFKRSEYAGETDIIPVKDGNFAKRYFSVILGGLLGGLFACALIAALFFVFAFNKHIAALFVSFPIIISQFLINLVPKVTQSSDGSFLYLMQSENNKAEVEKYLGILYRLYKGETFAEMDEALFSSEKSGLLHEELLTVRLMREIELCDYAALKQTVGDLILLEHRLTDTDKELLQAYAVLKDDEGVEGLKYVLSACDEREDLRSLRTLIANAAVKGDKVYAHTAEKTALNLARSYYLRGEGRYTEKFLDKILKD